MNFERYQIQREIGRGSMGIVYEAQDTRLDRRIALKVLRADLVATETFVRRFLKEAKAAARLSHPNIVSIYDTDEEHGTIYIAMELLAGEPLDKLIKRKKFTEKEIVHLAVQTARVLDYAHANGIIHRDIKPGNIIVDPNGRIKITDFGVARIEDPSAPQQTVIGEVLGTPAYMSPEQALGKSVDGRTDIFSLGVVLYELCTGMRPFRGDTLSAILMAIIHEDPSEPRMINAAISPELARVIMKCMSKAAEDRFQTGKALADALEKLVQREEPVARAEPSTKKSPMRLGLLFATILLLLAIGGGLSYHFLTQRIKAIEERSTAGTMAPLQEQAKTAPGTKPEKGPDLDEARRKIDELEKTLAEVHSKQIEADKRAKEAEEAKRKVEEVEKKKAEADKRSRELEDAKRKAEELERQKAEAHIKQAEADNRAKAMEDAKRKAEELEGQKAKARIKQAEADNRAKEMENAKRKAEELERQKAPAAAKQQEASPFSMNAIGMEFVPIPAGKFIMGSPVDESGRYPNEGPQHEVQITRAFYMGKFEVKVSEFREFVRATGYRTEAEVKGYAWVLRSSKPIGGHMQTMSSVWEKQAGLYWDNPGFSQKENHPVTCLSWNDVTEFANWLSKKTGHSYRLPTEAEWEYACRAGTKSGYGFGSDANELEKYAWHLRNSERETHPVGQKIPNAWGLYDMHGNAREWCQDWYGEYAAGSVIDPVGPAIGAARLQRGGSWGAVAKDLRCAERSKSEPSRANNRLGFRLVRLP